jgi:hypothetical protein
MPEPLAPPCQLCEPNDGAWMSTPRGLKWCGCARGTELQTGDNQRRLAAQKKAQDAATKDAKVKRSKLERLAAQRRQDRQLAARYREMPLIDGGDV